ncbi:hypothetical protein BXZ70DRAFT_464608 [Cristinia sonorae]|uniref:C2H2-type domain-containing protein n=1 Tax=Cristinia sonorae TaxID=1940300 RepID=A0A8K0UHA9_9AGAR|nr:hypothetical protein BXZ70DRAFT_464608 [Cristinia sonorae]
MAYCERCDRHFGNVRALEQHVQDSDNHSICTKCNKDFTSQSSLLQHLADSSSHHYCKFCDEDFDDNPELVAHWKKEHQYCCSELFESRDLFIQHKIAQHHYCKDCDRIFQSWSNLDNHRRSSLHQDQQRRCPRCPKSFISIATLALHFDSGSCSGGITRHNLNRYVLSKKRYHVIVDPTQLEKRRDGTYLPPNTNEESDTSEAWDGDAFDCVLCHKEFGSRTALAAHLQSAAHAQKIYRCPETFNGCDTHFGTLSGLLQHVEGASCDVGTSRKRVDSMMESLTNGLRRMSIR